MPGYVSWCMRDTSPMPMTRPTMREPQPSSSESNSLLELVASISNRSKAGLRTRDAQEAICWHISHAFLYIRPELRNCKRARTGIGSSPSVSYLLQSVYDLQCIVTPLNPFALSALLPAMCLADVSRSIAANPNLQSNEPHR